MRLLAMIAVFFSVSLTGCAHMSSNQMRNPDPAIDPPAAIKIAEAAPDPPRGGATAALSDHSVDESTTPAMSKGSAPAATAKMAPVAIPNKLSTPKSPTRALSPAASAEKFTSTAPSAADSRNPPRVDTSKTQLDFNSLVQRLKDTSAIGIFTKLSIKNQVDDLLEAFREFHAGHTPPSLDELHHRYDGLLLKVVTLVQYRDAGLASSISSSRGAIWEKLSDRESFQSI